MQTGEIFIVEMQYASQDFFRERALYYVSRTIDDQIRRRDQEVRDSKSEAEWKERFKHYRIEPVYGVFLTNFCLEKNAPRVMRDIVLCDRLDGHRQFTDKLRMIFLELPALEREADCDTMLKKWLYVINNSEDMENISFTKDIPIFQQLEEKAKLHALTPEEQNLYETDRRNYFAYWGGIWQAERLAMEKGEARGEARGRAEGRAEEKRETARKLKELQVPLSVIVQSTGLTEEEISEL